MKFLTTVYSQSDAFPQPVTVQTSPKNVLAASALDGKETRPMFSVKFHP